MQATRWLLAVLIGVFALPVAAQDHYSEGPVVQIASIKITFGHFDDYMKYLDTQWKKEQEALKAAGLIVDYAVYAASPRNPKEADIYLATTYANMAALDNFDARSTAALAKALGTTREQDVKGMLDRNAYREVLGVETVRELKLK